MGFVRRPDVSPFAASATMKNKLTDLRAERGWTQAELAARLQVSRQTVNAIETERYEPSLSLAFSIARLFRQPIEAIFQPNKTRA
jgi:putative transcriptional regulator